MNGSSWQAFTQTCFNSVFPLYNVRTLQSFFIFFFSDYIKPRKHYLTSYLYLHLKQLCNQLKHALYDHNFIKSSSIHHFHIVHNANCLPPTILHKQLEKRLFLASSNSSPTLTRFILIKPDFEQTFILH